MTDPASAPAGDPGATRFYNGDHAYIGVQAGVIHGDVKVDFSALDPATKAEHARRSLESGLPREAEKLFEQAHREGYETGTTVFFYVLSIVSRRHVQQVDFDKLAHALQHTPQGAPDRYGKALPVLRRLVRSLVERDPRGSDRGMTSLHSVLSEVQGLEEILRSAVLRHFDLMLTGGLRDEVDASEHRRLLAAREAGTDEERRRRVPLFFIPDPAPPVRGDVSSVSWSLPAVIWVFLGACLLSAGVVGLVASLLDVGADRSLMVVALLALTGVLAAYGQYQLAWRRQHRRLQRSRYEQVDVDPWTPATRSESNGSPAFRTNMRQYYDLAFHEQGPKDDAGAREWDKATAILRTTLVDEAMSKYGRFDDADKRYLGRLYWLARLHAVQARRRWDDGEWATYRSAELPWVRLAAYVAATAVALVVTAVLLVDLLDLASAVPFFAVGACLLGAYLLFVHGFSSLMQKRASSEISKALDRQHEGEQAAYEEWLRYLQDRPSDHEMAQWLAEDARYVRVRALRQYRLREADVHTDLLLTEGASGSPAARYDRSPTRYLSYIVQVFLLTEHGVRHVAIELDFAAGSLGHEWRRNFRYEVIASVTAQQLPPIPVQAPSLEPSTATAVDGARGGAGSVAVLMRRRLLITLTSSEPIDFTIGSLTRRSEEVPELLEEEEEASGVESTLGILEAVAADGQGWFLRSRRRYLQDYTEAFGPEEPVLRALAAVKEEEASLSDRRTDRDRLIDLTVSDAPGGGRASSNGTAHPHGATPSAYPDRTLEEPSTGGGGLVRDP